MNSISLLMQHVTCYMFAATATNAGGDGPSHSTALPFCCGDLAGPCRQCLQPDQGGCFASTPLHCLLFQCFNQQLRPSRETSQRLHHCSTETEAVLPTPFDINALRVSNLRVSILAQSLIKRPTHWHLMLSQEPRAQVCITYAR